MEKVFTGGDPVLGGRKRFGDVASLAQKQGAAARRPSVLSFERGNNKTSNEFRKEI